MPVVEEEELESGGGGGSDRGPDRALDRAVPQESGVAIQSLLTVLLLIKKCNKTEECS